MPYYYEVVFDLPLHQTFTYFAKKDNLQFKRVKVQFKKNFLIGIVVSPPQTSCPLKKKIKAIEAVIDKKEIITPDQYQLALWISYFYLCSLGESISLFISFSNRIDKNKNYVQRIKKKKELKKKINLNSEQEKVFQEILSGINKFNYYLIYGVTGSGKTFLYLKLVLEILNQKKQALILLPEIAMLIELEKEIKKYFDREEYEIYYGKISQEKKNQIKARVKEREKKIILGTRSALFLPWNNLGIIIIDEEHDESYKNNQTPRYSSKVIAQYICRKKNIGLVLVSATPSVETFYYAKEKKIIGLPLLKRFNQNPMPVVNGIQTNESEQISKEVYKKIHSKINNGEQVIIYLNQRGYSNSLSCPKCYEVIKCFYCAISLTYHQNKNKLLCHYCSRSYSLPKRCFNCGHAQFKYIKYGTEKIKEELKTRFTDFKVEQFDSDSLTSLKKIKQVTDDFSTKKINILVGTQMIIKGYNFKKVGLVVIFHPEKYLLLPDYKVNQRIISHFIQAAGRAGRGETKGEVIIQTSRITSYPINIFFTLNKFKNYENFYFEEIRTRKQFYYPPFIRLLRLIIRGKDIKEVKKIALKKELALKSFFIQEKVIFLEASPCLISKIDKNYRWNIIIKIQNLKNALTILNNRKENLFKDIPKRVYLELDLDPVNLY